MPDFTPKPPSKLFTVAAWASLAVPLLAAVTHLSASGGPPEHHSREHDDLKFKGTAAVCAASLAAGWVSLAGVRRATRGPSCRPRSRASWRVWR